MEHTKGECGCTADNTTGEITYCSKHRACDAMYEALKALEDGWNATKHEACMESLAKARGE